MRATAHEVTPPLVASIERAFFSKRVVPRVSKKQVPYLWSFR
jgi:hypothetical protein